jgi:hypothetical protein
MSYLRDLLKRAGFTKRASSSIRSIVAFAVQTQDTDKIRVAFAVCNITALVKDLTEDERTMLQDFMGILWVERQYAWFKDTDRAR